METSSPPVTPSRQVFLQLDVSPVSSHHGQLRRRTGSFSSNHDRSPVTPRSKHRFSNASQYFNEFLTPGEDCGAGLGNLADELGQMEDEEEPVEEATHAAPDGQKEGEKQEASTDGARDSGIDVSYSSRKGSLSVKNFSKPFKIAEKPPDEEEAEREDMLSLELEEAMNNIARMSSYTSTTEDPLIPRTVTLLQNLGNQASFEAGAQRLCTSSNSLTSHLTAQGKRLQAISASFYSPFAFIVPLDPVIAEETVPLVDALLKDLPLPDPLPLQGLQKLDRETTNVIQTLSQLTDTLQMGKQITSAAARHLRTTQTIVTELRRERESADLARHELVNSDVERGLRERRCAAECNHVSAGFEEFCEALRESLESDGTSASV